MQREWRQQNTYHINPVKQFEPPGFTVQFLSIGPRPPAKHCDNAKQSSRWIMMNNEHEQYLILFAVIA